MMIFNSFTVANDLFTILARNDRKGRRLFLTRYKTFEGTLLSSFGKIS